MHEPGYSVHRTRQMPGMGLIHIPVTVRLPYTADKSYSSQFLADTGATDSMAPASELRQIGIKPIGVRRYELADGAEVEYEYGLAQMEFLDEISGGIIVFGPETATPILGATPLESAGIWIDPATHTLRKLHAVPLK